MGAGEEAGTKAIGRGKLLDCCLELSGSRISALEVSCQFLGMSEHPGDYRVDIVQSKRRELIGDLLGCASLAKAFRDDVERDPRVRKADSTRLILDERNRFGSMKNGGHELTSRLNCTTREG